MITRRSQEVAREHESLLEELQAIVRQVHPHRAIVFGSFARGEATEESDIDLVVILDKRGFSKNYAEFLQNKRLLSKALRPLRKRIPIDLLVYTQDEWEYLQQTGSSFVKRLEQEGIDLL